MKQTSILAFGLVLVATAALAGDLCLQDQYGNQYDFVIDSEHRYVYGTMTSVQGCDAPVWPLLGSYVGGPLTVELTAANPLGDGDFACISEFKLKGQYPNFAWYYDTGYGAQESAWVSCGAAVPEDPAVGGARR